MRTMMTPNAPAYRKDKEYKERLALGQKHECPVSDLPIIVESTQQPVVVDQA
jgi:hypothetical protein